MNVHRTKMRLKSLLSGLLCLGVLLSQTPMVFAADSADEPDVSVAVGETQQAEVSVEGAPAGEPLAGEPSAEEPQAEEPQAAEESCAVALLSLTLEDGEVEIATAQDLADLAAAVNAGTEGYDTATVILTQDIDLSTLYTGDGAITTWTPIGSADHPFTGEFDGGNYTVSGLTITAPTAGNQALFGVVSGKAYIYDLTVEGSVTVTATLNNNAGVIGSIDANATGVVVESVTSKVTVNGYRSVGGIVGLIDTGAVAELLDCTNEGSVTATPGTGSANIGVGGIAGTVLSAGAAISNCSNGGTVNNLSAVTLFQGTGGIVGYCAGTVKNCTNTGAVTGANNYYVGGIAGWLSESGTITGCTNGSAADTAAGAVSGGIGQGGIVAYSNGSVSGCTNYGAVSQTVTGNGSGGIAYYCNGTISQCFNYGAVDVTINGTNASFVGGIAAVVYGTVTDCENHGAVATTGNTTSARGTGGVAGCTYAGGLVYNSSNSGAVTVTDTSTGAKRYTGGVVGYMNADSEVRFCSNTGAVSRGPATAGAATSNAVAGVAGYVAGSLRNCWSTGAVTYSGSKAPTASIGGVSGIVNLAASGSLVQDCYATGKISLTSGKLTEGTVYAYAIGTQYSSSVVKNCVYYCADYTDTELAYLQPMLVATPENVSNCFARQGDTYVRVDDTSYALTAEKFADADGVLSTLNSRAWKLEENAAYPTLLSAAEFQALNYTVTLIHSSTDTAAEENTSVTAALYLNGNPITDATYTQAKKGDQLQLVVTVPANVENTRLVVSANDNTRLSEPTISSNGDYNAYAYTITVFEGDLEVRYALVDNSKDSSAWYFADPSATEFIITRPDELAFLGQLTSGTALDAVGNPLDADNFSGKTVRLGADLDLSNLCHPADAETGAQEVSWTPISGFTGTFDGGVYTVSTDEEGNTVSVLTGRHTIRNLYVNIDTAYAGLFGEELFGGKIVVQNLIMDHAVVRTTEDYAAAIDSYRFGYATNCTVKNSEITGKGYVGGVIAGYVSGDVSAVFDCTVENTTVTGSGDYVGGVIGAAYTGLTGYAVSGNKTVNTTVSTTGNYVGGIMGSVADLESHAFRKTYGGVNTNQVLGGSVSGGSYVGGLVGQWTATGNPDSDDRVMYSGGNIVTATVTGTGDYVGGIAGAGNDITSAIYYNYNAETGLGVSSTDGTAAHVGALVGGAPSPQGAPGSNISAGVVAISRGLYLNGQRQEDENGGIGLTAESFALDEALYLLQGDSNIHWELREGADYPTLTDTAGPTLYKLAVRLIGQADSENSLAITPLAESSEGYPYHLYGTAGSEQWTYATENTVIPLTVTVKDGWQLVATPSDAVTVTPAEEENGADAYAVTLTADTTVQYTFTKIMSPDTSWYDGENPQTGYTITTEEQLRGLAQLVNAGSDFVGITLTLANDLTLEGGAWTPIGDSTEHPFSGSFDGGDHTINGLFFFNYEGNYAGLFGCLSENAAVENLSVYGEISTVGAGKGYSYAGGVAGYSSGSLANLTSGVNISLDGAYTTVLLRPYAGGVVGWQAAGGSLDGAVFTGTITSHTGTPYLGGLVGMAYGQVLNGTNYGQFSGPAVYAGGIVGYSYGDVGDCRNAADLSGLTGTVYAVGGIVGYSEAGSNIFRCGNDGAITMGAYYVGGVAGTARGAVISQVYNKADVTSTVNPSTTYPAVVGGIVGFLYTDGSTAINILSNSYNTGSVAWTGTQSSSTSAAAGGLVGFSGNISSGRFIIFSTNVLQNCYNTAAGSTESATIITAANVYTGGILGYGLLSEEGSNCYNLDTVTEREGVSATALSSEDLKNAASQLGIAFTADPADDESINGGYPVLHWEVDDPSKGVTLNFHDSDLYTLNKNAGLSLVSRYESDIIVVLSPEEAKVEIEKEVTAPEGFVFNGWYADKTDESTKYDPETTELKLGDSYERYWDLFKVTVTLDLGYQNEDGTQATETVLVPQNALMDQPANPEYAGHDFLGWYAKVPVGGEADAEPIYVFAENPFDFSSTPISEDITLYAKWQEMDADTDWYSEESSSFTITAVPELFGFAKLVNSGTNFAGKTVALGTDLDLTGLEFHAIGTDASHAFSGTFDGANYTISNLTIKQPTENYQALFGYTVGGEIKDLTVLGSVTGKQYVAGILAYGTDTALSNLTFGAQGDGSTVTSTYSNTGALNTCNQAGGVVGTLAITDNTTLTGLVNYGTVSGSDVGGVLYTVDFSKAFGVDLTLKDCANYGSVNAANRAGGVAVYLFDNIYVQNIVFDGCVNAGDVVSAATATYYAGGILGYGDTGAATTTERIVFTFNECVNRGSVAAPGAGGIVGYLTQSGATAESHASFVKCENAGSVSSATLGGGGIIGRLYTGNYTTLTDCVNAGEITGTSYVAGIVGYSYNSAGAGAVLTRCVNLGDVSSSGTYVAGILIDAFRGATLTGCYNAGSVTNTGTSYAAGLAIGYSTSYRVTLNSCFNYGAVSAAAVGSAFSAGRYVAVASTAYTLENSTYQYTLSEDGTVTMTPVTDADTVAVAKTADEFRDGIVLEALNEYFTSQDPAQDAIWHQGANYPVLVLGYYTAAINSDHAAVTIEDLPANEDGTYTVLENAALRFTVTPNAGYSLSAVTVNGETLTAGEDGVYTLTVTGNVTIAVSVKRTSWSAGSSADDDIEKIISSVAAGTNEKTESPEVETDYDETLDYNDDGTNNLLDILNILLRQETEETENSGSDEVLIEAPNEEEAPSDDSAGENE